MNPILPIQNSATWIKLEKISRKGGINNYADQSFGWKKRGETWKVQLNKISSRMKNYPHWSRRALMVWDWAGKKRIEPTDPTRRPLLPVDWPNSACRENQEPESLHYQTWERLSWVRWLDLFEAFKNNKSKASFFKHKCQIEIPPAWSIPVGEAVEDDFFNNELKKLAKTPSEVPVIPVFVGSI